MVDLTQNRKLALGQKRLANENAYIRAAAPATRYALRAQAGDVAICSQALEFKLPDRPKTSRNAGDVHALWIGPDEWLIYGPQDSSLGRKLGNLPGSVSAVDISHRNTAVIVSGTSARNVLAAGCPQNLNEDAFPVGACSRTIFGKVEVILHRTGHSEWRVECWRSFSEYVWDLAADSLKLNAS
jgi:sarcosine oxidase subunit gamma